MSSSEELAGRQRYAASASTSQQKAARRLRQQFLRNAPKNPFAKALVPIGASYDQIGPVGQRDGAQLMDLILFHRCGQR